MKNNNNVVDQVDFAQFLALATAIEVAAMDHGYCNEMTGSAKQAYVKLNEEVSRLSQYKLLQPLSKFVQLLNEFSDELDAQSEVPWKLQRTVDKLEALMVIHQLSLEDETVDVNTVPVTVVEKSVGQSQVAVLH